MKIAVRTGVTFHVTLELTEGAARALLKLTEFDAEGSRIALIKGMTAEFGQAVTKSEWQQFLEEVRASLSTPIQSVDAARDTLSGNGSADKGMRAIAYGLGVRVDQAPAAVNDLRRSVEGLHCDIPEGLPRRRKAKRKTRTEAPQ